jgi:hypothetical protein
MAETPKAMLFILFFTYLAQGSSSELGEKPLKRAVEVGFTQRWGELSEKQRLKLRSEAGVCVV